MENKKSLSFLEILVSALILAVALAGILASFVGVRRTILRSNKRLAAFNLARGVLEGLYKDVREDTWNTGRLRVHTSTLSNISLPPENINYSYQYRVSNVPTHDYRQVTVRVSFPED